MCTERILVCNHFYLDELFPKEICDKEGINALTRIDQRILKVIDSFRDLIGKPTWINNWIHGGNIDEAGWRDPNTSTGAKMSAHKQIWDINGQLVSLAVDLHVSQMTGSQLNMVFLTNAKEFYTLGVRCIEHYSLTPGWLHLDLRPRQVDGIAVVDRTSIVMTIKV